MGFADLHLHTIYSDGTYQPDELVQKAMRIGLSAISVADHDTVAGIIPTIEAAKNKELEIIPGIEFTSEIDGLEVHILGYLFDYTNVELLEQLVILKENRIQRIHTMVEKLQVMGVNIKAEDVFGLAGLGTIGRLHLARALVKNKVINTTSEAFYKYIGQKDPGYVLGFKLSPEKVIRLIRNAGGVTVLAHPYSLNRDDLIPQLVNLGLNGLEVYYPEHSTHVIKNYLDMAKKLNLIVTGGSDCHGQAKTNSSIGTIRVSYELVEKLKELKEKLL